MSLKSRIKQEFLSSEAFNASFLTVITGGLVVLVIIITLVHGFSAFSGESTQSVSIKDVESKNAPSSSSGVVASPHPDPQEVETGEAWPLEEEVEKKEEAAEEPQSLEDMKQQVAEQFEHLRKLWAKEGITVDREKKRIEVKGAIIRDKTQRRYPIEYVVVAEGGNTHEAMVLVKAKPSNLNAALLSLGLTPGKTVSFRLKNDPKTSDSGKDAKKEDASDGKDSEKEPAKNPVEEQGDEVEKDYEIIPPTGHVVYIYVKYEGWKEQPIRLLEDLIIDYRTGKSMKRTGWVYVGSRFAKVRLGRKLCMKYLADMERNIVATYLTGSGNSIFDINSLDGIRDTLFDVNPDTAPPMGSKVTMIFSLEPLK